MTEIVIVGAGPYGISLAAHLNAHDIDFKLFGRPMQTWRTQMPRGMHLKSEGFASNLYEPTGTFTLKSYCNTNEIAYADIGVPVSLDTFCRFGIAFQERFVPELDERDVAMIEQRSPKGFRITLEDGECIDANAVVIAVGISRFAYLPEVFRSAPPEFVTHSSAHHELTKFRGRSVTVVGAGASAADIAGLLHEAGAKTRIVARGRILKFHSAPEREARSLIRRIRAPRSGLGQGWKGFILSNLPDVIFHLPAEARTEIHRRTLGPAPCWFTKDQIVGKVSTELGFVPFKVHVTNGSVVLSTQDIHGYQKEFESDHIIAATGYRVDLSRLKFLSESIRSSIITHDGSPILSRNFEASVPGLYFTGLSAVQSFGPLLRFAYGARFSAQRLTGRFLRTVRTRNDRSAKFKKQSQNGATQLKTSR